MYRSPQFKTALVLAGGTYLLSSPSVQLADLYRSLADTMVCRCRVASVSPPPSPGPTISADAGLHHMCRVQHAAAVCSQHLCSRARRTTASFPSCLMAYQSRQLTRSTPPCGARYRSCRSICRTTQQKCQRSAGQLHIHCHGSVGVWECWQGPLNGQSSMR